MLHFQSEHVTETFLLPGQHCEYNQGPEYHSAVPWPNSISIWFTFQKSWTFGPVAIRWDQAEKVF